MKLSDIVEQGMMEQARRFKEALECGIEWSVHDAPPTVLRWGVFAAGYDGIPHQALVEAMEQVLHLTEPAELDWGGTYGDIATPGGDWGGSLKRTWRRIKRMLLDEGRALMIWQFGLPKDFPPVGPFAVAGGARQRAVICARLWLEPATFEVAVDTILFKDEEVEGLIRAARSQARRLFSALSSATGYIALDRGQLLGTPGAPGLMATWQDQGRWYPERGRVYDASKWVVDVTWGTLLGSRQVKALGGFEAIQASAPAHEVERIAMAERPDDEPGAFLQLTERPQECTSEGLAQLRQYFEPVLPPSAGPEDRKGRILTLRRAADSLRKQARRWQDRPRYRKKAETAIADLEAEIDALEQGGEPNLDQELCRTPFLD